MASILKHLRSSTANKRPTASGLADGQIAINTASGTPALFFKDSASNIVKVGPAHVGSTAPNTSPAGSAGNSTGELWVDNSLTTNGLKYYNGTAFVNLTPSGTTSTIGLVELATDAETQAGTDAARAVTPSGLQSKISDSTSTSSSTTIASSTAVKSAYDLANAALPKAGGTITGAVTISPSGSLSFEGTTDDSFETTLAVVDPTADRTITLPNVTGTVITTGDSGTVTSTMIADGTIVDGDISASAEIAVSKLADGTARQLLQTDAAGTGVEWASNIDVPGTLDVTSTATFDSIASHPLGSAAAPTLTFTGDTNTGIYSPGADQVAISTNGAGRVFVNNTGLGVGVAATRSIDVYKSDAAGRAILRLSDVDSRNVELRSPDGLGNTAGVGSVTNHDFTFFINNTERARLDTNGGFQFKGAGTAGVTQAVSFNGSAPVNSLVIDSSGRVGLGTSTPGTKFDVVGGAIRTDDIFTLYKNATDALYIGAGTIITGGTSTDVAFRSNQNGSILFSTNGSTERMRLDASGRLGIGSTTPQNPLVVSNAGANGFEVTPTSNSGTTSYLLSYNRSTSAYTDIRFDASAFRFEISGNEALRVDSSRRLLVGTSSGRNQSYLTVEGSTLGPAGVFDVRYGGTSPGTDNTIGIIQFTDRGTDSTNYQAYAKIICQADGASSSANDVPGRLVFSTTADGASSPTENMRISSNRNIRIGTAGTSYGVFDVNNDGSNTYKVDYISSGGSRLFAVQASNGTVVNSTGTYTTTSDLKLKENIVDASSQWQDIKSLRIVKYNYKSETGYEQHTQIGVIAQEVEQVSPGLVFDIPDTDADGSELQTTTKGVKQSILYMKAVKALQEAMERIEALEQRLADANIA